MEQIKFINGHQDITLLNSADRKKKPLTHYFMNQSYLHLTQAVVILTFNPGSGHLNI